VDLDSFRLQETYSGAIGLEQENGVVSGYSNGIMITTEDEVDLLSNIIKTLNDTYGLNLTEEDKVDIQNIKIKLEENEELQAVMQADNPPDVVRYKFNQVIDQILLEFVHTKLDLYKKLTDPKVNDLFKRRWFEGYVRQMG